MSGKPAEYSDGYFHRLHESFFNDEGFQQSLVYAVLEVDGKLALYALSMFEFTDRK